MAFRALQQEAGTLAQQKRHGGATALRAMEMVALPVPCSVQTGGVLRVPSWPGYAHPDVVAVFDKRHGVKAEFTTVAFDGVLRAKVASAENPGLDLAATNTAEISRLAAQRLPAPLPLGNIPNTVRQLPRFRQLQSIAGVRWRDGVYGIPFTYSEAGLTYDRQLFRESPQSIAVLWDPRWQGKVLAFHRSTHGFALAASCRGLVPFRIQAARLRPLANGLMALAADWINAMPDPAEPGEFTRRQWLAIKQDELPASTGDGAMGPIARLKPVEGGVLRARRWRRIVSGERPGRS